MSWDEISARMDEDVDDNVADSINYSTDEGRTFTAIAGFVLFAEEGFAGAFEGPLGTRPRIKIRRSLLPGGEVARTHRLKHDKLGAGVVFRPSTDKVDDQGRYIVFDVQKAPTS